MCQVGFHKRDSLFRQFNEIKETARLIFILEIIREIAHLYQTFWRGLNTTGGLKWTPSLSVQSGMYLK